MPELGEVAHAAGLLRRFILGKVVKSVETFTDEIVFAKGRLEDVEGQQVTEVGRHGKYFWLGTPKTTVLLHFGMTGWINVRNIRTHFIAMENGGDKKAKVAADELRAQSQDPGALRVEECETEVWPPRFVKFVLHTDDREVAFVDARRLGRIRVFDMAIDEVLKLEPLSKLGLDYSQTPLELEEFSTAVSRRKVPIKSLLLDQQLFSGIGNWMADEILFQSRIHPQQYAHTLGIEALRALHDALLLVSRVSVEAEGNSAALPADWLMIHRWGKKKNKLPSGHVVEHVTVGGRTSCFVPELQVLREGPELEPITGTSDVKEEIEELPGAKKARRARIPKATKRAKQEPKQEPDSAPELDALKADIEPSPRRTKRKRAA